MFVLGIDPGLSRCGYGLVRRHGRRQRAEAAGVIRTDPATPLPLRLAELQAEVRDLITEYQPDHVAIERVLFQVNVSTAMQTGQASGVVMAEAASADRGAVRHVPADPALDGEHHTVRGR